MNHTAEIIIQIIDLEIVQQMNNNDDTDLVLLSSWGINGYINAKSKGWQWRIFGDNN